MHKIFLLLTISICSLTSCKEKENIEEQPQQTTYYLIRHAEKDRSDETDADPHLTEEGKLRAEKWAEVFKEIELDAIYSTSYHRTMETAQPVSAKKGIDVKMYDASNLFDEDFKKNTAGKQVLVVGHSNTTPKLANKIIGSNKYKDIDDSENGALFIIQVAADGSRDEKLLFIN